MANPFLNVGETLVDERPNREYEDYKEKPDDPDLFPIKEETQLFNLKVGLIESGYY